jgi:hypothetical protein
MLFRQQYLFVFVCIDAKRSETGYCREREMFGSDFNHLYTVPQVILAGFW